MYRTSAIFSDSDILCMSFIWSKRIKTENSNETCKCVIDVFSPSSLSNKKQLWQMKEEVVSSAQLSVYKSTFHQCIAGWKRLLDASYKTRTCHLHTTASEVNSGVPRFGLTYNISVWINKGSRSKNHSSSHAFFFHIPTKMPYFYWTLLIKS
jgi:hypothetical protein